MENNHSSYQSESSSLSQRIPTFNIPRLSSDSPTIGLGLGLMTGSGSKDEDDHDHDITNLQLGNSRLGVVFTVSQIQELQLQWMIYKYIEAGLRVPQSLLVPIWNSLHSAVPLINTPTLSLSWTQWREMSRYKKGVELDDEPGRCRRTDGKKWRCSKESLPDHKYCQKHMHRGRLNRNRSRKPVE